MADQSVKIDISLEQQTLDSFERLNTLLEQSEKKTNELKNATIALEKARTSGGNVEKNMLRFTKAQAQVLKNTQDITKEQTKQENLQNQSKQLEKMERQEKATKKVKNAYEDLNKSYQKTTELVAHYNTLLAQNGKLSKTDTAHLKLQTKQLQTYASQLKTTNAALANTGAIKGRKQQFDSLGFSVAQLTRESPAFLISANTGFMALSNNIPILVDEINKLTLANKAAKVAGEATVPVWKSVGKALFSWQSLVSVAILGLTMFGGQLVKWIRTLTDGADALDAVSASQENFNETREKGMMDAQKDIVTLRTMTRAAQDLNQTSEDRAEIIKDLNDQYKDELKHLGDKEISMENIKELEQDLIDLIYERAIAEARAAKATEIAMQIIEKQLKAAVLGRKLLNMQGIENGPQTISTGGAGGGFVQGSTRDPAAMRQEVLDDIKGLGNDIGSLNSQLDDLINSMANGFIASFDDKDKEKIEDIKDIFAADPESLDGMKIALQWINDEIDSGVTGLAAMKKSLEDSISLATGEFDFSDSPEPQQEFQTDRDAVGRRAAQINIGTTLSPEREAEAQKKILDSNADTASKILKIWQKAYDSQKKEDKKRVDAIAKGNERLKELTIAAVADTVNELFNIGSALLDAQLENINAEMIATEEKYDRMYDLAEGDKHHQAEIIRAKEVEMKRLEKEELKIRQKQAKLQKAQAVNDILINTAVAIMGIWKDFPKADYGIAATVASIAVGALGAAQMASVLAAPVPKYAQGRVGGAEELAFVGDGGRREVIVNKDGSAFLTPNKPTLAMLEQGANVYKNENTYRDSILNSIQSDLGLDPQSIEDAIAKGFEKAKVNNYVKMPPIKIDMDHQMWLMKNSNF